MLSNVFFKSLRDQRLAMVLWAAGIALLAGEMIAVFPTIRGSDEFNKLMESYPESLMAVFGITEMTDITSAVGFLNVQLFAFMAPLLFIIHGIVLGSGAIAGEEGRGTLEILLTEPITRGKLVAQKFAAMVTAAVALALVLWVVLVIGALAIDMDVSALRLAAAVFSLLLFGVCFGALTFAAGCLTGGRGASIAIGAGVAVGAFFLNSLSGIVSYMEPAKWVSPFFYYNGADPLANGLDLAHAAVLLVTIVILFAVGSLGLQRRDLRL